MVSFLAEPPETDASRRFYEADIESDGYVGNLTRVWCWRPDVLEMFMKLRGLVAEQSALSAEDWAVLVAATAGAVGDSYCSLAWGTRLASLTNEETAARVLRGETAGLGDRARALVEWARRVARDPNAATETDVERLRLVGLDDRSIFEATAFVAFRLAFSTINDALGAPPDIQLAQDAPPGVRNAVTYGRDAA